MKQMLVALAVALAMAVGSAKATIIGPGDFDNPDIIDFEDAPDDDIGTFYSDRGVANMVNLSGGFFVDTGTGNGSSEVAANFFSGFLAGEIVFDSLVTQAGFFISTFPSTTTLFAFVGTELVGQEAFQTSGTFAGGSFAGVEFLSGFDRLVVDADAIDPNDITSGAFAIDDLRFGGTVQVPEPATLLLLGVGLAGLGFARRRLH